jgi:hypothetical protein
VEDVFEHGGGEDHRSSNISVFSEIPDISAWINGRAAVLGDDLDDAELGFGQGFPFVEQFGDSGGRPCQNSPEEHPRVFILSFRLGPACLSQRVFQLSLSSVEKRERSKHGRKLPPDNRMREPIRKPMHERRRIRILKRFVYERRHDVCDARWIEFARTFRADPV